MRHGVEVAPLDLDRCPLEVERLSGRGDGVGVAGHGGLPPRSIGVFEPRGAVLSRGGTVVVHGGAQITPIDQGVPRQLVRRIFLDAPEARDHLRRVCDVPTRPRRRRCRSVGLDDPSQHQSRGGQPVGTPRAVVVSYETVQRPQLLGIPASRHPLGAPDDVSEPRRQSHDVLRRRQHRRLLFVPHGALPRAFSDHIDVVLRLVSRFRQPVVGPGVLVESRPAWTIFVLVPAPRGARSSR